MDALRSELLASQHIHSKWGRRSRIGLDLVQGRIHVRQSSGNLVFNNLDVVATTQRCSYLKKCSLSLRMRPATQKYQLHLSIVTHWVNVPSLKVKAVLDFFVGARCSWRSRDAYLICGVAVFYV